MRSLLLFLVIGTISVFAACNQEGTQPQNETSDDRYWSADPKFLQQIEEHLTKVTVSKYGSNNSVEMPLDQGRQTIALLKGYSKYPPVPRNQSSPIFPPPHYEVKFYTTNKDKCALKIEVTGKGHYIDGRIQT